MSTYFIFGPEGSTPEDFKLYYKPQLQKALEDNRSKFILRCRSALDRLAIQYLKEQKIAQKRIRLFVSPGDQWSEYKGVGYIVDGVNQGSDAINDTNHLDKAMTISSSHDITAPCTPPHQNVLRRQLLNSSPPYHPSTQFPICCQSTNDGGYLLLWSFPRAHEWNATLVSRRDKQIVRIADLGRGAGHIHIYKPKKGPMSVTV